MPISTSMFDYILTIFDHLKLPKQAKMASKIDPKMKRKTTWGMTSKSWKYYEKAKYQNLENLPCGRGAHFAKSASFKKITEDVQTNH